MCEAQLTAARVIQLVSEQAGDQPVHTIETGHVLSKDFGFDSLDRVELVIHLEDEFKVSFPDPVFDALQSPTTTVLDLILAVERSLSANKETTT